MNRERVGDGRKKKLSQFSRYRRVLLVPGQALILFSLPLGSTAVSLGRPIVAVIPGGLSGLAFKYDTKILRMFESGKRCNLRQR